MKKWKVINTEIIPKLEYVTKLSFGEDGLSIDLIDEQYCTYIVNLYFGKVISYRCIDEGDMLFIPYTDEESFLSYRESAFTNILFRLNGDNYFHEIKKTTGELYAARKVNHYLVVTLNYFIDIISIYGIEISVENLKTKEKQHIQFDIQ